MPTELPSRSDPRPTAVIESLASFADLQAAVLATVPPACCTLSAAETSPPGCAWYVLRARSHSAADAIREVRATLVALQSAAVASDYFRIVQGAHFADAGPESSIPASATTSFLSSGAAA